MGYHGCPIEPSDWTHGNGDEPPMDAICPKCYSATEEMGDGTWKCDDCGWAGTEPKFVEPPDYEPDMSDFV